MILLKINTGNVNSALYGTVNVKIISDRKRENVSLNGAADVIKTVRHERGRVRARDNGLAGARARTHTETDRGQSA